MDRIPAKRSVEYDNNSLKRARLGAKANQSRPRVGSSPLTSYAGNVGENAGTAGHAATPRDSGHHGMPEVAADFADSLQDLKMNNQYEISSLTIIARENAEHAMAISHVLENHISQTPPTRKLPALYVLDSIVKNVGGLYKIQVAHNLYSTFMDAYTLVDGQTRKSMEAMLKTWKEAIPGSMDTRPVFPVDTTRRIENALIKARTAFVQQQQQQSRTQRQIHPLPPRPAEFHHSQTPPPSFGTYQYGYQNFAPPQQSVSPAQYESAGSSYPQQPQTPILKYPGGYQVPLMAVSSQPATYQQSSTPILNTPGAYQQHVPASVQQHFNYAPAPALAPAPAPTPVPAITNDLAALLSGLIPTMTTPVPHTPLPSTAMVTPQATIFRDSLIGQQAMSRNDVLLTAASLKKPRPDLVATTLYDSQPSQCGTCGRRFPTTNEGVARKRRHLDFHFRTNMRLADAARTGVSRSWFIDEMQWIAYREVDDADDPLTIAPTGTGASDQWIDPDISGMQGAQGVRGSELRNGNGAILENRQQYVKVPTDAGHQACPICQEEFEKTFEWLDDTREQEWVWMGAVRHREKVYHATCLRDLTKDGGR